MDTSGKVQVTVVHDDPVVAGFLHFLEEQMTKHPEDIVAADSDQQRRIGELVNGVTVK